MLRENMRSYYVGLFLEGSNDTNIKTNYKLQK